MNERKTTAYVISESEFHNRYG